MNAEKFKSEFLSFFDDEFEKADFDYIENDVEIVNPKNITACISKIMELIAIQNNLKLRKEFLNLDYAFFEQKSMLMTIAVEHENYINRRKRNFKKLINTAAKLKVLICYFDEKEEDADKILDYYQRKYKELYPNTSDKFLMILGKIGFENSQDYKIRIF